MASLGQVGCSVRAVVVNPLVWIGDGGGQGTARPILRTILRKRIALLLPRLQWQEQTGYIPMDEGYLDLD